MGAAERVFRPKSAVHVQHRGPPDPTNVDPVPGSLLITTFLWDRCQEVDHQFAWSCWANIREEAVSRPSVSPLQTSAHGAIKPMRASAAQQVQGGIKGPGRVVSRRLSL